MKKTCPACGGTGQVTFFKGVSRFLLSWEECPECDGLGFTPETGDTKKKRVPDKGKDRIGDTTRTSSERKKAR